MQNSDNTQNQQQQKQLLQQHVDADFVKAIGLQTKSKKKIDLIIDDQKGRVLVAKESILPGQTVLKDSAFIYATWFPYKCFACHKPHASKCKGQRHYINELVTSKFDTIALELSEFDAVGDLDRARCFLKCLAIVYTSKKNTEIITKKHEILKAQKLAAFLKLTSANIEVSLDCIKNIKKTNNQTIINYVAELGELQVAQILGILNTNSHELADFGGSGVYLLASMLVHSCAPNCNFTTHGNKLWINAIKYIRQGEYLSIDYHNLFYQPTQERINSMKNSHRFICDCPQCTIHPDLCRAFVCQNLECTSKNHLHLLHQEDYEENWKQSVVCPSAKGEELAQWKCCTCNSQPTQQVLESYLQKEKEILAKPPQTIEDVDQIIKEGILHESHYCLFKVLETNGRELASSTQAKDVIEAESIWYRVIRCAERVLPRWHNEKIIYYDILAQIKIKNGKIEEASGAYRDAYEISCMCSGKSCPPTRELDELVKNPPTSAHELRMKSLHVKRAMEEMEFIKQHEDLKRKKKKKNRLKVKSDPKRKKNKIK